MITLAKNPHGIMATRHADDEPRITALGGLPAEPTSTPQCHVWPGLCTTLDGEEGDQVDAHGRHFDHAGRTLTVRSGQTPDDPEIWAEFTHLSGSSPHIAFMGERLTPAQTRERANELRRLADDMDQLADQVDEALTVEGAVARFDAMRTPGDRNLNEFLDEAIRLLREFGDPGAFAAWFLDAVARDRAERAEAGQ